MAVQLQSAVHLAPPDGEEVMSAARRYFAAGLCCAVETERDTPERGASGTWEPRLLLFPSAKPAKALAAVEDIASLMPSRRVRVAGYESVGLARVPSPAAVICSPLLSPSRSGTAPRSPRHR